MRNTNGCRVYSNTGNIHYLVLIKGSQGMRMEKIVEEVMAEPQDAEKLLCRQDKKWRNKPFVKP